ncbi:amino acid permease [Paenibacillus mucilaginosus]|uniref:YbgF n=3 Tax=Paenibacillus mucilaginosus TaxID=61624 RepID=H6NNE6_9BACL|nr:amino acid permease [Paenibacillus mucilaginosus]AEI44760.1 YbgF [Paenibacillus mucilaginosus KNP414]AFC32525.1 YbgF [Paenibacillus mucilaginosus 3016]AFH64845.1 amino acid permease [Paenibacillus mucilaginosus K02]MCG7214814.1 amino acid permease [Paenibacillus mucilaginosus]WDM26299.1 amino acid permease [Paenibacillus mucilaginosus]
MTNQDHQQQTHHQTGLQRTMKSRHLYMISLGGVIGTGLFISSGYTINQAGPGGALLAYLVGGFIMYLVMMCLGELSVAMPVTGSFQTYAARYIGPATGFTIGWLYWLGWVVTLGSEFTAAGLMMKRWFPHVPVWLWCVFFVVLLFLLNAMSAKAYAETEYWLASIKLVTIILFIGLGGAAMFGLISPQGGPAPMLSNFTGEGGLFPNGLGAILFTMIAVNFSYQGSELVGIAAGESEEPEKTIPRSIKNTVWRVIFFFVASIFIVAGLIPWKEAGVEESPFVTVFDSIGIPYAADIMNFVILSALLSVANSGLYAASRMLWALSKENMAPGPLGKLSRRGVPLNALLVSIGVACLSLLSSVFAPDTVYLWLVSIAGLTAMLVWMGIAASQYMFRRRFVQEGGDPASLKYRVPMYPLVPVLAFVLCTTACVGLAFDPEQRMALYCGIPFILICYALYYLKYRNALPAGQASEPERAPLDSLPES